MSDASYIGTANLEVMEQAVNYNAYLLSLLTPYLRRGDNVIDFGAGTGTFAFPVAQRGVNVVCIEPDRGFRAKLARIGLKAYAHIEDLAQASCDFIYTFNVLEHIEADDAAMRLLVSRLRPGGRLLVYVPAFPLLYSAMDRNVGHVRRYQAKGLGALARGANLRIEQLRYVDSLGFLAALVYRWIGNSSGILNPRSVRFYDRVLFPMSRVCDHLVSRWFGKNLVLIASKPLI